MVGTVQGIVNVKYSGTCFGGMQFEVHVQDCVGGEGGPLKKEKSFFKYVLGI